MENRTQSARILRHRQIEGSQCCTAEIVEIPAPIANNERFAVAGIVAMLVAATGSSRLARIRAALCSHPQKAVRLLRKLAGSVRSGTESGKESFQFALKYRRHTVLRCTRSTLEGFSAAFTEHPGYKLSDSYFSISSDMPCGHSLPLEVLIVLQPPQFSALEREIEERVPAELSFLNQTLGTACAMPFVITEEGCALGGLLSKVAVMTLRRGEDHGIKAVEQKWSGTKADTATPSTEDKNLTGTAAALLQQYLQAQM